MYLIISESTENFKIYRKKYEKTLPSDKNISGMCKKYIGNVGCDAHIAP